jgi:hypothetical protein
MDEISYELREEGVPSHRVFCEHLTLVAGECHWTSGAWPLARDDVRRWNELQNTPRDIRALSDYIVTAYRRKVRGATISAVA